MVTNHTIKPYIALAGRLNEAPLGAVDAPELPELLAGLGARQPRPDRTPPQPSWVKLVSALKPAHKQKPSPPACESRESA